MATSRSKAALEKKPATGKTAAKTPAKKPAAKVTAKTAATTKTTAVSAATKKPAAAPKAAAPAKTSAAKQPAAPRARKNSAPSPEERYRMVQEAAYYIAEKDAFSGCSYDYWIAAEAQIETMLGGK